MRIEILIPGKTPRNIEIRDGETLSQVVNRVASDEFPVNRVQSWYCNQVPVGNASTFVLQTGMSLAGTPKVDGGNA
jgi:hypothetical protein